MEWPTEPGFYTFTFIMLWAVLWFFPRALTAMGTRESARAVTPMTTGMYASSQYALMWASVIGCTLLSIAINYGFWILFTS